MEGRGATFGKDRALGSCWVGDEGATRREGTASGGMLSAAGREPGQLPQPAWKPTPPRRLWRETQPCLGLHSAWSKSTNPARRSCFGPREQ